MKKLFLCLIISSLTFQGFSQLEYFKGFRDGFKEGYCHSDFGCVAPVAPVGALKPGERFVSYKDGYNNGYAAGIQAKQSAQRDNYRQNYNQSSNNIVSMYNPDQEQQFFNAVAYRQAIFTQNKEYAENLMDWVNLLKTQSNDQQFLKALESYRNILLSFRNQDLSTLGNKIKQVERGIEVELNKASSRENYIPNTSATSGSYSQFYPGVLVKTSSGPIFRAQPNSSSSQIRVEDKFYVVKIVRQIDDNYFEVELNGKNVFISKAFLMDKVSNETTEENDNQYDNESIYKSAVAAFREGNFADARNKIEILLSKDRNSDLVHFRGMTFLYEENFTNALSDFNETLMLNPKDTGCYYDAGYTEYIINDYKNALIHLTKHIQLNPLNLDAHYIRGSIKSKLGDKRGAILDYDFMLSNFEDSINENAIATVLNNKAYCLVELGDYNSALPIVNKALGLEKNSYFIWDTRGELYYKIKKYQDCISDMTKAISIKESDNSYYYRGLAKIMLKISGGCDDLSKSGELGKMEAYESIKKFCNK